MRRVEDAPALSAADVSERISAIVEHKEFLFYRVAQSDDLDWILGAPDDGYEMFCTACGQRFFEKRDRKHTAKHYLRSVLRKSRRAVGEIGRGWRQSSLLSTHGRAARGRISGSGRFR